MNFSKNFYLKHRLVVMNISRDLFVTEPGQRLYTIEHYIENFSVSRGTIQMAIQFLVEKGCISTQFCGHLGTFLLSKNMEKLWEYTGIGTLAGAISIPLDSRTSGLATGICDCMRAHNISFNCIFIHGSYARLNSLVQGKCDFIIVTTLAYQVLRKSYNNIKVIMDLPGCSYSTRYVLFFKNPSNTEVENGMTVAFDPTSIDQSYLTKLVCKNKKKILFKRTPSFFNTWLSVTSGESDVTVVNSVVANSLEPGFQSHIKELHLAEYAKEDTERLSTPVILILKDNYGLDSLLKKTLHKDIILKSQKGVMEGTQLPNFF